jgi:hypothetical protein
MEEPPVTRQEIAELIDRIFKPRAPRRSSLDVLAGLAAASAALRRAEDAWLAAARDEGWTWTQIARALGITRQSARARGETRDRRGNFRR